MITDCFGENVEFAGWLVVAVIALCPFTTPGSKIASANSTDKINSLIFINSHFFQQVGYSSQF
jgi:hypothetical protein